MPLSNQRSYKYFNNGFATTAYNYVSIDFPLSVIAAVVSQSQNQIEKAMKKYSYYYLSQTHLSVDNCCPTKLTASLNPSEHQLP